MGFYRGPRVIQDGLVLALDAGSTRSYPGTGTTWTDLSGNGNHATLSNSLMGTTTAGVMTCGTYDADVPASTDWSLTGDFTVESWIYPTSFLDYNCIVYTVLTGGIWFGRLDGSGFGLREGGVENVIYTMTLPTLDVWSHTLVTRIGSTINLYVNGVDVAEVTDSRSFDDQNGLSLANDGGAEKFIGEISIIKIYKDRGFSQADVTQNFNAQKGRFGL